MQRVGGSAAAPQWLHSLLAESGKVCLEGSLFLFEKGQKKVSACSVLSRLSLGRTSYAWQASPSRAVPSLPVSRLCVLEEFSVCSGVAIGKVGSDHPFHTHEVGTVTSIPSPAT